MHSLEVLRRDDRRPGGRVLDAVVCPNALDHRRPQQPAQGVRLPLAARRARDAACVQLEGEPLKRLPIEHPGDDLTDDCGLLRDDYQLATVGHLAAAVELGHALVAVRPTTARPETLAGAGALVALHAVGGVARFS